VGPFRTGNFHRFFTGQKVWSHQLNNAPKLAAVIAVKTDPFTMQICFNFVYQTDNSDAPKAKFTRMKKEHFSSETTCNIEHGKQKVWYMLV
jgi:hypothetical protein